MRLALYRGRLPLGQAAVLGVLLVTTVLRADDAPKPSTTLPAQSATPAPAAGATPADAAAALPVVQWDQTEQHIGEQAIVEGRVLGVHCSPLSCVLAFDPSFSRFRAVVQAQRFTVFPPERLSDVYSGKRVQVRGTIAQSGGRPEIVVAQAEDLTVMAAERRREQEEHEAQLQQANADLLDTVSATLERLETLAQQILESQQRLEALLATLEQRTAALEGAAAAQQTPAATGPPPRAGYERMRTVKRGMSRTDVARLMGDPQNVEQGSGGWATWYWDSGQTVTFDGRGRAQSLSGFTGR